MTARLKPHPFKTEPKDENPMRDTFVESHPFDFAQGRLFDSAGLHFVKSRLDSPQA